VADENGEQDSSLSDSRDRAIRHAWIALLAYAALRALAAMIGAVQQPEIVTWFVGDFVFTAIVLGLLALGIQRRSRAAAVGAIIYIVAMQLYTWFIIGTAAGTIISVIVIAFLLRGAKRISEIQAENRTSGAG
jgi:hypothetical protein